MADRASVEEVRALFGDPTAEAIAELNAYAAEGRLGDLPIEEPGE